MRVDSVISINAHPRHKQHATEYTGISTGKTTSGTTFADYFKANLQQLSSPVVSRQTENQLAGLLFGYYTPLKITHKEEPKKESNAG